MSTIARKVYQRLTNFTFAAVLAVSSLTAAMPFVFSQNASAAGSILNTTTGETFGTIKQAVQDSDTINGHTLEVSGSLDIINDSTTVNKDLTIRGVSGATISTTSTGSIFRTTAAGVTIENLNFVKTDNTSAQILIEVQSTNVTIQNNTFTGQFVLPTTGATSRAIVASNGVTGLAITSNSFTNLRQPAYLNNFASGAITNNYVTGTRGWVVEKATNFTFTGNTWGNNTDNTKRLDIAIIPGSDPTLTVNNYSCQLGAIVAANNGAVIEDQYPAICPDVTAPTFAIVSPSNGAVVSGVQDIEASITDESDIAKVLMTIPTKTGNKTFTWEQGKLNNSLTRTGDIFSVTIDTATLYDGLTHVVLRGTDTQGNVRYWNNNAANRQHGFVVDNTNPTTPQFITPSNEQYFKTTPIQSKWTPSTDTSGILKYQVEYIYDDGHTFAGGPIREVSGATTQRNHTPASHEQGGVTIRVRAVDTLGNVSDWSDPIHYYYDATPPTSSDDLDSLVNGTVTITQTISDNVAAKNGKLRIWKIEGGVQDNTKFHAIGDINVNGDDEIEYVLDTVNDLYGDGEYVAKFTARDMAGHEIVTQKTFFVDNTGPAVSVNGATYSTAQPTVTGTVGSDATGVSVEIQNEFGTVVESGPAAYVGGDTTWSYALSTALSNGTYTVIATAVDSLGNDEDAQADVTVAVVIITPDNPDTTEEDETETETQTIITPIITPPSANGDEDVQGATDENDQDVAGSAIETPAQVDTDGSDGNIFGLAWYWWIAILAALTALVWGIAAALRRRQEA